MKDKHNRLTEADKNSLLGTLKRRFEDNMHRHPSLDWKVIEELLFQKPKKLSSIHKMEETGGKPDVVQLDQDSKDILFIDCSKESPQGRRKLCYDLAALEARKKHRPENNALDLADDMGIELLSESQYRKLQTIEAFDLKSSSWIKTPDQIRSLGGALFCDRRYDKVFVYHNGAESYYAARGFRGVLWID